LGLKITQRQGTIWIYDLNALFNSGDRQEIYWTGDSQTLGADKVLNNVKIDFSPYVASDDLIEKIEYTGKTSAGVCNH